MTIKSIVLAVISSLLWGAIFVSCNDDSDMSGKEFIRFSAGSKTHTYLSNDSIFQRCELHVGSSDKFSFSFDETFKSNNTEFYSLTFELFSSSEHCPTTSIDNTSVVRLDLAKQNDEKKFMDYISSPDFDLTWSQKYDDGKIKLNGTFKGWLYQYYTTRPAGGIIPEPQLLDSVYLDKGEFQVSVNY